MLVMEKNYYDLELIKILEEHIENEDFQIINSDIYVDKVNANLPFAGSRVYFELLDKHQRIFFDENEAVVAFVKSIAMEVGIEPDEKVENVVKPPKTPVISNKGKRLSPTLFLK